MIAILAEGQDDAAFIVALLQHIHEDTTVQSYKEGTRKTVAIPNGKVFDVIDCNGRDNLLQKLRPFPDFPEYSDIIIIFDSDGDIARTFAGLQSILKSAKLSLPQKCDVFTDSSPRVLVKLIEPYDLESLVYPALEREDVRAIRYCVEAFMECLTANNALPDQKNLFKTRVKAFFAAKASKRGRIELSITGAVRENLFDFNHPNFADLKAFLQQL